MAVHCRSAEDGSICVNLNPQIILQHAPGASPPCRDELERNDSCGIPQRIPSVASNER